jgi:hypothetical protein
MEKLKLRNVHEEERAEIDLVSWFEDGKIGRPHWVKLTLDRDQAATLAHEITKQAFDGREDRKVTITVGWMHVHAKKWTWEDYTNRRAADKGGEE